MFCHECGERCEEGVCLNCGALRSVYPPKKMTMQARRRGDSADHHDPLFHPEDERQFAADRTISPSRTQTHPDLIKYDSGLD
jgi:hypothetical protein